MQNTLLFKIMVKNFNKGLGLLKKLKLANLTKGESIIQMHCEIKIND